MQFCIKHSDGHISDLIAIPGNPGTGPAPDYLVAQAATQDGVVIELTTPIVGEIDLAVSMEDPTTPGRLITNPAFVTARNRSEALQAAFAASTQKTQLQVFRATLTKPEERVVVDGWIAEATVALAEANAQAVIAEEIEP